MVYGMATQLRHCKLVQGFVGEMIIFQRSNMQSNVVEDFDYSFWDDNIALLYQGKTSFALPLNLISFNSTQDISLYNWIEPDFMLFHQNKYTVVEEWKIKGYPDLIVEVWSKGNPPSEREWKQYLYSTGKNTEHWYLEQDSNEVECWFESEQLSNQTLQEPLTTQNGITFDLRYLAIQSLDI